MGIYINNNGTIERKDGAPGPAGSIAYDNSQSGLVSNNVQNAVDEVNERVIENISDNSSIELTVTASHPHAVGTSFMLIGQLVKTTSAIEVGDTIVVGTNVEPTSVLDLLGDVNTAIGTLNSELDNRLTIQQNLTDGSLPQNSSLASEYSDGLTFMIVGSNAYGFPENYSFGIMLRGMANMARNAQLWFGRSGKMYYRYSDVSTWTAWVQL